MFKIGDKVKCIPMSDFPDTRYLPTEDHRCGGYGYEEGLVFVIREITSRRPFDILWEGHDESGVYSFAVRHFHDCEGILTKEEIDIIDKLNKL